MIKLSKLPDFLAEVKSGVPAMPYTHYHHAYELYYLEAGKREYLVEIEVRKFAVEDVITTSVGNGDNSTGDDEL